ncbi:hypothetical protein IQ268_08875 [Oculatella sp. LEGE 06141]|uniref:hypothetical protein n=1 Tax=Oculatella sp. LEGE 06141 TaxID=1828648 RepID=UPI0018809A65|nr:hypothetical protein [Oculatella sp. LEGE 06141]MBE9178671.1 hypothetical protein [Oculatella sp. LEGE 06141]
MKVKPVETNGTADAIATPQQSATMEISVNDDGSIAFFLEDGQECVFREPTGEDVTRIESFVLQRQQREESTGMNALIYKAVEILCVQHGDRPGITYKDLTSMPLSKLVPNQRRYKAALDFFRFFDSVTQLGQLYGV